MTRAHYRNMARRARCLGPLGTVDLGNGWHVSKRGLHCGYLRPRVALLARMDWLRQRIATAPDVPWYRHHRSTPKGMTWWEAVQSDVANVRRNRSLPGAVRLP